MSSNGETIEGWNYDISAPCSAHRIDIHQLPSDPGCLNDVSREDEQESVEDEEFTDALLSSEQSSMDSVLSVAFSESDDGSEYEDPTLSPECNPKIEELKVSLEFIRSLRNAQLDSAVEPIDPELLHRIHNPINEPAEIDADQRFSIDIFLSLTNASEASYDGVRSAMSRRCPEVKMLSLFQVKRLLSELSGVSSVMRDMCINSCIGYTGYYSSRTCCPFCSENRYMVSPSGVQGNARKQFSTIPLAPQLQAIWRSKEGVEDMEYRRRYTESLLQELSRTNNIKQSSWKDFFDGSDYIDAVKNGDITDSDMVLALSIDGAQLYQNKASDCWIFIWIILDRAPEKRYKKRFILPGGFIPGPNKPKNLNSFIFPAMHHLCALQKEGLRIWNVVTKTTFTSYPFLALVTADGPAMATMNGGVGHHGRCHCRHRCKLIGRHKPGSSHYYPARFKPHAYNEVGCNHEDVNVCDLLQGHNSDEAMKSYFKDLAVLLQTSTKREYDTVRLETGIAKPHLFLGLVPHRTLGVPAMFAGDSMHLISLNLPKLLLDLWRGTIGCDSSDRTADWPWLVLATEATWRSHGQLVSNTIPYIPCSFDRPPRNPAEKMKSGYKAWEFLLYIFGLGPCLMYGLLPHDYWINFCQLVRGMRIMLQEEITEKELQEAHSLITRFSDDFERIYVDRRTDRIHFVRACVHAISHLAYETLRIGPPIIFSQWSMERTIGNLGEEIRQHSNAFSNLAERGLLRCKVNAMKMLIPDLDGPEFKIPRGAEVVGDGYVLLPASETVGSPGTPREMAALHAYIKTLNNTLLNSYNFSSVRRWARLRLPNGQIARSRWLEDNMQRESIRAARNVKVCRSALCLLFV